MHTRPLGRMMAAVLLAATAAACGDDGPMAPSAQPTLYDKYGGAPTVRKLVDDSVTALLADPVQAPFFAALGQPGNVTPERLTSCLRLQFTALLGGPASYPGRNDRGEMCRDMAAAHANLGITGPVFDGFIAGVSSVLRANGVADADIASIAPALVGMRSQIVTR